MGHRSVVGEVAQRLIGPSLLFRELHEDVIGEPARPDAEEIGCEPVLAEPFARFQQHLAANGFDLDETPATLGAPPRFDPATEMFTGENSTPANALRSREYRKPFVVPQLA